MKDHSLRLAAYWRHSLADAENDHGALSTRQAEKLLRLPEDIISQGVLPAELTRQLFLHELEQIPHVGISLRPWVYQSRLEHGLAPQGRPDLLTPLICHLQVDRQGRLYPAGHAIVPRDLLEPLEQDSLSIGSQDDLDAFLTREPVPAFGPPEAPAVVSAEAHRRQWTEFLAYGRRLLETLGGDRPAPADGYERTAYGYVFKQDKPEGYSRHIIALYDHLRRSRSEAPLFDRYAQATPTPLEDGLLPNSRFAARLAHAGDRYALAPAQRDALSHLLVAGHGEILAVNGPPGTGKTTLLLSVVASLWAKAALTDGEPPVIVASSTNNQAVTQIITAFGKDFAAGSGPLAGRWLPDLHSFGGYFPRTSAETELSRHYQTRRFFHALESQDYLDRALPMFMSRAAEAFPDQSPGDVRAVAQCLQAAIREHQQSLHHIEQSWTRLRYARHALQTQLGDDPQARLTAMTGRLDLLAAALASARARLQSFRRYRADESLFYALFGWFGPVAEKRLRRARQQLDPEQTELLALTRIEAIEDALEGAVIEAEKAHQSLAGQLQRAHALEQTLADRLQQWRQAIQVLPVPTGQDAADIHLEDCDRWADTSLRFEIFRLASHYWEARWLAEVIETLPEILDSRHKQGRRTLERNWRRWMKLTPCIVATFFRLPAELQCTRHNGSRFVDDYALDFIDLLIVDEAGQVLPEVAGASFALARQALVIGDTQQIEPIWSLPAAVDVGNLVQAGVLQRSSDLAGRYAGFQASGRSAASGSVMAVAQQASRYHPDPALARGLYLYEHRRGYDEIISYCNALCYKGRLKPMRPDRPDGGLPPLGYLHIDGLCQAGRTGSRSNRLEAQTIAAWIQAHAETLQARYQRPLGDIIGVITPFAAQAGAIERACAGLGLATGKTAGSLSIGTVHAFQGAERPVILFSAVYSKHADGGFVDARPSMLNVAVSRAKDSFLVFGDMDVFSQVPVSQPRGLLMQYLAAAPGSRLEFAVPAREDLQTPHTGLVHLHEAADHDRFLRQTLREARRELQIVTPWIRLQWMRESGVLDAMRDAADRGLRLQIYTDPDFNRDVQPAHPQGRPERCAQFSAALSALQTLQIPVHMVSKVHSKLLMADDDLLCVGSFNWLSAARHGAHARHETSMVYRGADIAAELQVNRHSLQQRLRTMTD